MILTGNMGIQAQELDTIKQLQTEIKAAITTEFGSYDEQSPLFEKVVEMACDFYNTTDIGSTQKCTDTQACTFAVQALRYTHNIRHIQALYCIAVAAVAFFEQSHKNALSLMTTHANNNMNDNKINEDAYAEIKNIITQKIGSSPESERCLICAVNLIKMGVPVQDVTNLTTLITTSNIADDIDSIDEAYYTYFTAIRYFNKTHKWAIGFVEFLLELTEAL